MSVFFINNFNNNDVGFYTADSSFNNIERNNFCNNLILDVEFTDSLETGLYNLLSNVQGCSKDWSIYGESYCLCNEFFNGNECINCNKGDINDDLLIDILDIV